MILFAACMLTIAAGGGYLAGYWHGFHAPIDDRYEIDQLARRDRGPRVLP